MEKPFTNRFLFCVGALLLEFLEYYAGSLGSSGEPLVVADPFNPSMNVAHGMYRMSQLREVFQVDCQVYLAHNSQSDRITPPKRLNRASAFELHPSNAMLQMTRGSS